MYSKKPAPTSPANWFVSRLSIAGLTTSISVEFSSNRILNDTKPKDRLGNKLTFSKGFLTTPPDFLILYKNLLVVVTDV